MADGGEAYRRAFGVGKPSAAPAKDSSYPARATETRSVLKNTERNVFGGRNPDTSSPYPARGSTPRTKAPAPYPATAGREQAAAKPKPRGVSKPDTSEQAQRTARIWNQEMRRELTEEEWGRLNPTQKNSVRFNGELLKAYDQDLIDSPLDRRNSKGLISQLGLEAKAEGAITSKLGLGVGPAVRYDELFAAKPGSGVLARGAAPSPFKLGDNATIANPQQDRQKQVNALASKLSAFMATLDQQEAGTASMSAEARKDEYTFKSPEAKSYYEMSFDFLKSKEGLGVASWREGLANLQADGFDPEDFKSYVLDRIQLLPPTAGQSTVQDLQSWFK